MAVHFYNLKVSTSVDVRDVHVGLFPAHLIKDAHFALLFKYKSYENRMKYSVSFPCLKVKTKEVRVWIRIDGFSFSFYQQDQYAKNHIRYYPFSWHVMWHDEREVRSTLSTRCHHVLVIIIILSNKNIAGAS